MGVSRLGLGADHGKLSKATDALHESDDSLAERIPEEMRMLADRLATVARRRALEEPTFRAKQRALRAELSAGVSVEDIPGGARITTSMPDTNERNLPQDTDNPVSGWRHPVFGHRDRWVHQDFAFSWFRDSVATLEAWSDGRDALVKVVDEAARSIADKTAA